MDGLHHGVHILLGVELHFVGLFGQRGRFLIEIIGFFPSLSIAFILYSRIRFVRIVVGRFVKTVLIDVIPLIIDFIPEQLNPADSPEVILGQQLFN